MDKEFTHIEPTDTCKQAAVHYMEDCQEVDDFVRRGIDEIVERYFCKGYEQAEQDIMEKAKQWFTDNIPSEKLQLLWCEFEQFITE